MADWFRSETWTEEDRAAFEARLARARPGNRTQYLRIQGVHLDRSGHPEHARELWRRALGAVVDGTGEGERWSAMELLAASLRSSDPAESERLLRRLLEENPSLNGTGQMARVDLAELLIDRGGDALGDALDLLRDPVPKATLLPVETFRVELARARLYAASGRRGRARRAAARALEAGELASPYENAPGLAVGEMTQELHSWLTGVAATGTAQAPPVREGRRRWWRRP